MEVNKDPKHQALREQVSALKLVAPVSRALRLRDPAMLNTEQGILVSPEK